MDQLPEGAIPVEQDQSQTQELPPGAIPIEQSEEPPQGAIPVEQASQISPEGIDYGSSEQQFKTGLEGAGQGFLGPAAPWIETHVMGVKPEDIAGRSETNPIIKHGAEAATLVGSMLTGTGEAGLIAKALPEFEALSKVGAGVLRGALESGAFQGSDELTKIMTQPDPNETVPNALAHMAGAALLGGATGGLFGIANLTSSKGLKALEDTKLVNRADSWLKGFGAAGKGHNIDNLVDMIDQGVGNTDKSAFLRGVKDHNEFNEKLLKRSIDVAAPAMGEHIFGPVGLAGGSVLAKTIIDPIAEKILRKPVTALSGKYILPNVVKALTSDTVGALPGAIEYSIQAAKGAKKLHNAVEGLFSSSAQQIFDASVDPKKKQEIKDAIDSNKLDQDMTVEQPQSFAHGGVITQTSSPFSQTFPQESMMLQAAKTRVYNHLKVLKPQNITGTAFDNKEPSKESKRKYDNAVEIAAEPLRVLRHIKKGELTSEHISNLNAMYPELGDHIRNKVTERITKAQLKGEKPNYKVRQGLSILMGTPLESVMTPFAIQAAQSVFAPKQSPQSAQNGNTKKGTSKLGSKTNDLYQTPDQNADKDRSIRD